MSRVWTLPNQITFGRLVLCGFFVLVLALDSSESGDCWATAALAIFVVASISDWVDGFLARRYGLISDLGKLLDPLADKVLISGALIALIEYGLVPFWVVVLIISREFLITGLRIAAAHQGKILAAERAGKHKTISQMVAIISSLTLLSLEELGFGESSAAQFLVNIGSWLFGWALLITVVSGGYYLWKNRSLFNDEESEATPPPLPKPVAVTSTEVKSPAFKEWRAVVEGLGQGTQLLILRKGGISEGEEGFKPKHPGFWLLPTEFHQQLERTKPEAKQFFDLGSTLVQQVEVKYWAESVEVRYLKTWGEVRALDRFHLWKEEILKERFDFGEAPGIHALVVRIFRLKSPQILPWCSDYDGCKSWVELPLDPKALVMDPVISNEEFQKRVQEIPLPPSPS